MGPKNRMLRRLDELRGGTSESRGKRMARSTCLVSFLLGLVVAMPILSLESRFESPTQPLPEASSLEPLDTDNPVIAGDVEVHPEISYRMYDMFETPWSEWWGYRKGYEINLILSNQPHQYTMLYNRGNDGLGGITYAPYRWNVTASNLTTIDIDRPGFMPTLGPPDVPSASAALGLHWNYINDTWFNSYWYPKWHSDPEWKSNNFNTTIRQYEHDDGYVVGASYTIEMNREGALTWLNLPVEEPNVALWWSTHSSSYASVWENWILNEANSRVDIYCGYDDMFYSLGVMCRLTELPSGDLLLEIGHFSWGYEVLQARWLTDAQICTHETYMEDFTLSAEFSAGSTDLTYDTVCQWSLRAVRANGTESGSAWAWEPMKIDFVTALGHHSEYTPYEYNPMDLGNTTYTDWNALDPNYGFGLGAWTIYENTPAYFNLTSHQKLTIVMPRGDQVIGYKGEATWVDTRTYTSSSILNATRNNDFTDFDRRTIYGRMTLGYYKSGGVDIGSMYDVVNNSIVMQGPLNFDNFHHLNGHLYHGAPWIEFDLVSDPVAPTVEPLEDIACLQGDLIRFEAVATDANGDMLSYVWDFGDETSAAGNPAMHSYAEPGDYTVVVTVHDGTGLSSFSSATVHVSPMSTGYLRVTTSPSVPSMISVDGEGRACYGINWLPLEEGNHTISFGDVIGYATPSNETVHVSVGHTTAIQGNFTPLAQIGVGTYPFMLEATISVDGIPMNEAVLRCYLPGGWHTISWGKVRGYDPPVPYTVYLTPGGTWTTAGVYQSNESAQGPDPSLFGYLRVQTDPAVNTVISVDGQWRSQWGLNWLKIEPGIHRISFTDVPGFETPEDAVVSVSAGEITVHVSHFAALGSIKVATFGWVKELGTVTMPTTILVDGVARNTWGLWISIAPGWHDVSFGDFYGWTAPAPTTVWVSPGICTTVTGSYSANF